MARKLLYLKGMQTLITSSRMPYALAEIRALSREGHVVHAADTFANAPGSRSTHASFDHETLSPRDNAVAYHAQLSGLVDDYDIELVIPTFEEVFYLTYFGLTLGKSGTPIFAPTFETLRMLHDKASFARLCLELGLDVATTRTCTSKEELREATQAHEKFFARAVFSRAGTGLYTNAGPLAGEVELDDLEVSRKQPWIVQPFLQGEDLCTFSVVRHGKVVAHSAYRHPKTLDSAGGIVFESVEDARALEIAQTIAEATGFHGQLSLDLMTTADGTHYLIECNPRPTAGVCVMPTKMLVDGILGTGKSDAVSVAPAGVRRSMRSALLRDMIVEPSEMVGDLQEMFSDTPDVYFDKEDPMPGLYQFLSLSHVLDHWRSQGNTDDKLALGYLHDVCWDGEALSSAQSRGRPVVTEDTPTLGHIGAGR